MKNTHVSASWLVVVGVAIGALHGCGAEASLEALPPIGGGRSDGGPDARADAAVVVDAAIEDAALGDAAIPDAQREPDAWLPDAGPPDAAILDSSLADANAIDAAERDAASLDATTSDAKAPDANVDACVGEAEAELRANACAVNACGARSVVDRCGVTRSVDCGAACASPPVSVCADTATQRTFSASGTCAGGTCRYVATDTPCAPASCTNGVATGASVCSAGVCSRGVQQACAFGCSGSACAANPCATVTCTTPPASSCLNASTRRTFANTGTCSGASGTAVCTYAVTDTACGPGEACSGGACVPPLDDRRATTGSMTGPGLSDCGASGADVCARAPLVVGGTFNRGASSSYPATIADVRLDKYEITVGRFRKFVDAWVGGWRPAAASGKHAHLNGGLGLVNAWGGGYEPGWEPAMAANVGGRTSESNDAATTPATKAAWDANLVCDATYAVWTSAPGANERLPMNCLSWYDVHAFCIWDGGFLPSRAEWEYASVGGSEQRKYPWGATLPSADATLAVYGCYFGSTNGQGCTGIANIAPVGTPTAGAGRWGQLDLVGSLDEWYLDWARSWTPTCVNCAGLEPDVLIAKRTAEGGTFNDPSARLQPVTQPLQYYAAARRYFRGGRCARLP